MSDLWSDRIDLTDLEAVIDEHGGLHVAYNLHEDLLCVKEKAKADKLATIEDVVGYCFAYLVDNYESNFEGGENQLAMIAHDVFEAYKNKE